MIYTVLRENNIEAAYLLDLWDDYHRLTFSPECDIICTIEFGRLKGKNYQELKACIQDKANDFSNNRYPGLTYSEHIRISDYLYKYASRFGLLEEFKENGLI